MCVYIYTFRYSCIHVYIYTYIYSYTFFSLFRYKNVQRMVNSAFDVFLSYEEENEPVCCIVFLCN